MRKTLAMLACTSALALSGCIGMDRVATTNDPPEVQARANHIIDTNALWGVGMRVMGAVGASKAGDIAATGDIERANAMARASVATSALGDYNIQRAAQISANQQIQQTQNQTSQIVYVSPQVTTPVQPSENYFMFLANGWNDVNRDGAVSYDELVGMGKNKFSSREPIECGIFGISNPRKAIKFSIRNINTEYFAEEPSFRILDTNSAFRWDYPANSLLPGVYKFSIKSDSGGELGSLLFEVTN